MSKKHQGHYCRICGRYRANEKFSGGGHKNHICKDCARLPVEKRNEIEAVNRLMSLPFRLSKQQRIWLEKMKEDMRDDVRDAAVYAYDLRFSPHLHKDDYDEYVDESFEEESEYDMPELATEEIHRLFDD